MLEGELCAVVRSWVVKTMVHLDMLRVSARAATAADVDMLLHLQSCVADSLMVCNLPTHFTAQSGSNCLTNLR